MRKALIATAIVSAVVFISPYLMAWGGPGNCCGPDYDKGYTARGGSYYGFRHLEFLKEEIGLSEDQLRDIIKINSEYRLKYFNNRNDSAKLDELRTEHRNEIDKVFTQEQKNKLDEYYKNRDDRRYYRRGWRR
jgi:hypothetical protein